MPVLLFTMPIRTNKFDDFTVQTGIYKASKSIRKLGARCSALTRTQLNNYTTFTLEETD